MSFSCFIPGGHMISANTFQQVDSNRWVVTLNADTPINELVAFISAPLQDGSALGCHIASAPFDSWHYLGSITNEKPSVVFKTRYVWSAADSVPTTVQFGVSLEPVHALALTPPELASAEVLEAGTRIGKDLYSYLASFAVNVTVMGEPKIQLPANSLERWLNRFKEKCRLHGLDWLKGVENG